MQARPGDQVIVRGHHIGEPDRKGQVLEARGPDSTAPFLVRWDDTGHITLMFPGNDAMIDHLVEQHA